MCMQATSAPVDALPSATEIRAGRDRNASRRRGIEKKMPNQATAHPLTVLSMIGVNPAGAFNRDRQREDRLNVGFERLFRLNMTALTLDEALSTRHAQFPPPEPPDERPIQTTAVGPCIGHPGHG